MHPVKLSHFCLGPAIAIAAVLLAGCQLTPTAQTRARIQEKPTVFNALTPKHQDDILGGAIERGNTRDMVYLALGKPEKVVTSADGTKAMWVFVEHYAAGPAFTTGFNGPNASHYVPGVAGSTSPGAPGQPKWAQPMGAGGDSQGYLLAQMLVAPEIKTKTVYVFFVDGKVVEIKLDGDASDQQSALNRLPVKKPERKSDLPRSMYDWDQP